MAIAVWALGRGASPLRLAAVTSVVVMFWAYRKHYDVVLMSLPLVELWRVALVAGRRRAWAVLLLVGLTLWIPLRDAQWYHSVVSWGDLMVWSIAGVWLTIERASLRVREGPWFFGPRRE